MKNFLNFRFKTIICLSVEISSIPMLYFSCKRLGIKGKSMLTKSKSKIYIFVMYYVLLIRSGMSKVVVKAMGKESHFLHRFYRLSHAFIYCI